MICQNCFSETADGQKCEYCGFAEPSERLPDALPAFTILNGRYMLGRVLGAGGFGITYLAYNLADNCRVAIKECVPNAYSVRIGDDIVPKTGCNMEFAAYVEIFRRERNAISLLKTNPSVVNLLDYFSENHTEYYVMDYVDGVSLKYLVTKNGGKIPYSNALYILLMIGTVLMDVHNNGIIHRDISPDNIMIASDGSVVLIDFGTAKSYIKKDHDEVVFLKHGFAPPEQYVLNGGQGPYTDIYALAATFYTIVSGMPLIDAKTRDADDTMKSLEQLECPGVPYEVSDIIVDAMILDSFERYQHIEDLFRDLSEFAGDAEPIGGELLKYVSQYKPHESKLDGGQSRITGYKYPYVRVLSGNSRGTELKIPDYGFLLIGRDPNVADLVLNDTTEISRRHCLVGYDRSRNRFVVIDRSSRGTYYSNGNRIMLNAETFVPPEDSIYICSNGIEIGLELL